MYRFGQRGISRRRLTARSEVGGRGWHLDGDYAAIRSEWEPECGSDVIGVVFFNLITSINRVACGAEPI